MKLVNWFWTKKYVSICLVLVICHNWLKSIERFFKCFKNCDQIHIYHLFSSRFLFDPVLSILASMDRPKQDEKEGKLSICLITIKCTHFMFLRIWYCRLRSSKFIYIFLWDDPTHFFSFYNIQKLSQMLFTIVNIL